MAVQIVVGDCREALRALPDCFRVNCCVTSPPYFGLRDYGHADQIGLERTPEEYVATLVSVFREVRRVLSDDGTVFLNLGDSYFGGGRGGGGSADRKIGKGVSGLAYPHFTTASLKPKDLIGIPWRVAFALQADGWYLRSDIIWHKPNPMPESVTDRPTKSHEYVFLLAKSERYYYDAEAIKEPATDTGRINGRDGRDEAPEARPPGSNPRTLARLDYSATGRNKRTVWTVPTSPFKGAHFATFPPALIEPCILAGCPEGGTVLDPFGGAGTTGLVADRLQRNALLIEINPEYAEMAKARIHGDAPLFSDVRS